MCKPAVQYKTMSFSQKKSIRTSIWLPILTLILSLLSIFSTVLPIDIQQRVVWWGLPLALCLWLAAAVFILLVLGVCALPIVLGASDD